MLDSKKTALVVEGGAMRGVFSTAILDGFLAQDFKPFDIYIGVSAGASNLAAYLAAMPKRNLAIYTDYALRPEFINLWRFLKGGHLMDLDWLWAQTIQDIRLDINQIKNATGEYVVVATDIVKGTPVYLSGNHSNIEDMLLASSAIPLAYRKIPTLNGRKLLDGGLADPLPIGKALAMGAKRIMVLRSRPKGYVKSNGLMDRYTAYKYRHYPNITKLLNARSIRYNDSVDLIRRPPPGIEIQEICYPDNLKMSRFGKDKKQIFNVYDVGFDLSKSIIQQW